MSKAYAFLCLGIAVWLASCANTTEGFSHGFFAAPVGEDGYYVRYDGSLYGSVERAQVYWLYNCAALTLSRGYDGFRVDNNSSLEVVSRLPLPPLTGVLPALLIGLDQGKNLQNNIRLLKRPYLPEGGPVFDAAAVKDAFEPYVKGGKTCHANELCPHPTDFLMDVSTGAK